MCVWVGRNSGIGKNLLRSDFLVWPVFNMLSATAIYYYYYYYYRCCIHGNSSSAGWATCSGCIERDGGRVNYFVHPEFCCSYPAEVFIISPFADIGRHPATVSDTVWWRFSPAKPLTFLIILSSLEGSEWVWKLALQQAVNTPGFYYSGFLWRVLVSHVVQNPLRMCNYSTYKSSSSTHISNILF